ncbi:MAG: TonB-dependent receptor domain-containing protein [Bacteroidales bacterium]
MPRYLPFLLLLILFSTLHLTLFSQGKGPGAISGKVVDAQNHSPIEYANMVLLDSISGKMITGMVTDSSGSFRLVNIPVGIYLLDYSFVGYEKQRTKAIHLSKLHPKIDLGTLNLGSSSVTMDEVTITAEKSMMINKIDRKVFNVQKDIQAQTGTVSDVLQTIPSVSVDMDGNISLRGSGNVTILINGRPSVMSNSANLEQMPASLIEKIEVITNPSAKYKPDGTAGIINIILKKEQKAGMNGILGANAGSNDRYNTNLQLNYNKGKVNLFGSYGFRQDYRKRSTELTSQSINDSTHTSTYYQQSSTGYGKPRSHLAQLGIDWSPTKKDATGLSGTFNARKIEREDETYNNYQDSTRQPTQVFTRYHTGTESETSIGLKAYYEHTFDKEDEHVLKADVEFQSEVGPEDQVYTNVYSFPDANPEQKNRATADNSQKEVTVTVSYNRPLWEEASLEVGYEGNMQLIDYTQKVYEWDYPSSQWSMDTSLNNSFFSNQTVHALYTTLSWSWKKFSVMGGLRAEEALTYLDFRTVDTSTNTNYFALYPTIHMNIASGKNEWQFNYSRRVNRPDGEDMNPVPGYRDPRNIVVGNPNLKPEDIHSLEFGYAAKLGKTSLIPTLFYRYKVNGFTMVTSNLNDSVLVTTFENLAKDQSAGLDLSGTSQIAGIINLNYSASGFYSQIDASNIGYSSAKSTFSWNAKLNASVIITKTTLFQVTGQYRSEALTAQGFRRPSWVVNLGFRQDFWKKKLSLIVTVSDLFNSQSMKTSINSPTLVQESTRRRDARVIYGGFVFNFGTTGKKHKDAKFEFDNGM